MSKIALFVEFKVEAAHREAIDRELRDHAAKTLAGEEGCVAFEVHTAVDDENTFLLYEVYVDQAALEAHRESEQLSKFRAAIGDMIRSRRLVEGRVLSPWEG